MPDVLTLRPEGLYCAAGDFYIDPWRPVARALITHGHSDHARPGSAHYLATEASEGVLHQRLGGRADAPLSLQTVRYGEPLSIGSAKVSFHPAGHVLGSAQIRVDVGGEVWVCSGDYKLGPDPTCTPFEPVRCHTFITESTFGLPIYRWPDNATLWADIRQWWQTNASAQRASVIYAYSFGKAQRLLAGILSGYGDHLGTAQGPGPVVVHGAVAALNRAYREAGVVLPPEHLTSDFASGKAGLAQGLNRALVIAPPSAAGSPWLKRFGDYADAFASGWMQVRGVRRRRGVDRGFVVSDHADWPGLMTAIKESGASKVLVTHGSVPVMVRYLTEIGIEAAGLATQFEGEDVAPDVQDNPGG